MEGLYLYINIHTSVYYPVNYVETDRSRDVFLGSRSWSHMNGCLMFVVMAGAVISAVNHREADVETTSPLSPRWRGAVLKVNYRLVKNVTLGVQWRRSLSESGLLVLSEMKTFIGPINDVENQHSSDYGYEIFFFPLREEHQTAPLFSLHLQVSTAFCSTFPLVLGGVYLLYLHSV